MHNFLTLFILSLATTIRAATTDLSALATTDSSALATQTSVPSDLSTTGPPLADTADETCSAPEMMTTPAPDIRPDVAYGLSNTSASATPTISQTTTTTNETTTKQTTSLSILRDLPNYSNVTFTTSVAPASATTLLVTSTQSGEGDGGIPTGTDTTDGAVQTKGSMTGGGGRVGFGVDGTLLCVIAAAMAML